MTPPAHHASPQDDRPRLIVGCMTGTSLDGLDVALVEVRARALSLTARPVRALSVSLGELSIPLRRLASGEPMQSGEITHLSRALTLLHAAAIRELIASDPIDLIVPHGQTIYHAPPRSWQLFTPALLARELNTPVVSDLRAADLAAGGQGAPITPLADYLLFRSPTERRTIINLGGFCNVTHLPRASEFPADDLHAITGGDICPCNHLLDAAARRVLGQPFDQFGLTASCGSPDPEAAEALARVLGALSATNTSLGTGHEAAAWVDVWAERLAPADLLATLCAGIARQIAARLHETDRLFLAGGGALNGALTAEIARAGALPTHPTDELGIPAAYREAVCMAVLGALCQDGVPITLPQITRVPAPAPRAGCWSYP